MVKQPSKPERDLRAPHELEGVGGPDTAPREYLLMMDHYSCAALTAWRLLGYVPRGKKALEIDWVGVMEDAGVLLKPQPTSLMTTT